MQEKSVPTGLSKDVNAIGLTAARLPDHSMVECRTLHTTREFKAGEEILIAYGALPTCSFKYKKGCCPRQYLDESIEQLVDFIKVHQNLQGLFNLEETCIGLQPLEASHLNLHQQGGA
jgi:hypothetical protein